MDRQISQKIGFYRRDEKRLRLYSDQFCIFLPVKLVLQYMFNQICAQLLLKDTQEGLKAQKGP